MNRLTLVAALIGMLLVSIASNSNFGKESAYAQLKVNKDSIQYVGVNVREYYTSIQNSRYGTPFPDHYYDDRLQINITGKHESYSLCLLLGGI